MESVRYEVSRGTLTLTLNRPEKLNCINWEMMGRLELSLDRAAREAEARVLVLRGAGGRSFSTGGDLGEFRALSREEAARWIRTGNALFDRIESLAIPTLAVIEGYAYGGGLELALCCDLRLAAPEAVFGSPELHHGWIPGWGGLTRLRRAVGEGRAREMIYLGESLGAEEAVRLGLVNWVVSREELEGRLRALVERLKALDPESFGWAKAALNDPGRALARGAVEFDVLATLAAFRSAGGPAGGE
jgi:enoyl-CoA hydratase/carnithine racemase